MKTKLSKKLLSVLLAVMMVVTSIPLMAFSALAADTDAIDTAIAAYEAKMNGTVYINMPAAYNAYVDAQKALDAYKYGNVNVDLSAAANALTAATNAMQPMSDPVANATMQSRDSDAAINEAYAKNLLYAERQSVVAENGSNAQTLVQYVQSANTIALYDGTNDILIPVFAGWYWGLWNYTGSKKIFAIYPTNNESSAPVTDSNEFRLQESWHTSTNGTYDWNGAWGDSNRIGAFNSTISLGASASQGSLRKWNRAANYMKYVGASNGFTDGLKVVSPGWYAYSGKGVGNENYDHISQNVANIYVVDYASVKAAMTNRATVLANVSAAKQGGAANLIAAYDSAISVAGNLTGVTPSNVAERAKALSDAANAINNTAVIQDPVGYADLKTEITASKATFNDGSKGYTDESWGAFETAYNEAVAIFANIQSTGYNNDAGAKAAADKLNKARLALEKDFVPVETELLEIIIKNADCAIENKNVFTADSYAAANLEALVADAKATIWANGTFDNPAAKIANSEENAALVTQFEKSIKDAVAMLKPNNDTVVPAANNYSLNSVIEYAGTFKAADYSNYNDVTKAVAEAQKNFVGNPVAINAAEKDSVANAIALYQSSVREIYIAILNLRPAFSKIQNGTVASSVIGSTNGVAEESIGLFLDNQITEITYFKTVKGTASFTTEYDLTIDNYWDVAGVKKGAQFHALGWGGYGKDSITVGGNNTLSIRYKEGGTAELNGITGAYDYHSALMKNESSYTAGQDFVDGKQNSRTTILGETTLTVTGSALTKLSYTTPDIYELFYINYNRYGGQKTAVNTDVKQKINVIDVSTLFELIEKCDAVNPVQYTDESYGNMQAALKAAKDEMPYGSMSADDIVTECRTRYNDLNKAFAALELRTLVVTFNYVNKANGQSVSSEIPVKYGQTLNNYIKQYNSIIAAVGDYMDDLNIYTFTGWSMPIDTAAEIRTDLTYTAEYTSTPNKANWDAYNNAKDQLLGMLTDKTFATADIQAVADQTAAMTYFAYDDAAKDATLATSQSAIDEEAAKLVALKDGLKPSTITADAFDAAVDELNLAINTVDPDRIDISSLDKIDYDSVVITASKIVRTIPYETQDELDHATQAIIENLNKTVMSYSVKLNGEVVKGLESVPYGTAVIVNSDGTYQLNVADTNENYDGKSVDWSYSYDAPSRGENGFTAPKYIVTAPSFGFIVKGNTELTSAAVASETEGTYVVTVKSNTGKIIDVATTSGEYTMPEAPLYANWIFDSYSNGYTAGQIITVTEDTVITANYTAKTAKNYHIDVFKSLTDWQSMENMESYDKDYNTRLDLTSDDVYCWVSAVFDDSTGYSYYTVISLDKDYSFYAYRAYDNNDGEAIVALSYNDYVSLVKAQTSVDSILGDISFNENGVFDFIVAVDGTPILAEAKYNRGSYTVGDAPAPLPAVTSSSKVIPVYTNNNTTVGKFAMIGSFVLPEGYEVLEYGILFTGSSTAVLSVDNVGADSKVARYKASRYTVGNQFVINMANPGKDVDFRYRAYAIIKDANGNATAYYSNVCSDNNYSF